MKTTTLDISYYETYSLDSIGIADISHYGNYKVVNPSFEITPPGFPKVNVPFVTSSVNTYRMDDLNLFCGDMGEMPEGIYKFKFSISPNENLFIEKSFLVAKKTTARLQKAYLNTFLECGESKLRGKIQDLKVLLEAAYAAASNCEFDDSYMLLKRVNKELSKIQENCDCNGYMH